MRGQYEIFGVAFKLGGPAAVQTAEQAFREARRGERCLAGWCGVVWCGAGSWELAKENVHGVMTRRIAERVWNCLEAESWWECIVNR